MKIKISFTEEERERAEEAAQLLRFTLKLAKVKESGRHEPFRQLYLASQNRQKTQDKG